MSERISVFEGGTFFAIDRAGDLHRVTTKDANLGNKDEVLRSVFAKTAFNVDNFYDGWNLQFEGDQTLVYKRLMSFKMRTFFVLGERNGTTAMIPHYARAEGAVEAVVEWTAPDTMALVLGMEFHRNLLNGSWFVAKHIETGRLYRLPVGNVDAGGIVCMGDLTRDEIVKFDSAPSMIDKSNVVLSHFMESPWNRDFSVDLACAASIFAFNKDYKQLSSGDWWKFCQTTSGHYNKAMERVAPKKEEKKEVKLEL